MSFAVAGLMAEHTFIKEQTCVEKSFPTFWDVFSGLYEK
jgi:5-enolpyruvylshikimate-3-phosphate synthase